MSSRLISLKPSSLRPYAKAPPQPKAPSEIKLATVVAEPAGRGIGLNFAAIPVFPPEVPQTQLRQRGLITRLPGPIQAKLRVGAVDDSLEHEADRVADQIIRMPDPAASIPVSSGGNGNLMRRCSCGNSTSGGPECEECKKIRGGTLQRAGAGSTAIPNAAPPIVHEALRSSGQPLDSATQAFFEARFDHDFKEVRIHTDPPAAASARAVNALAYTVGHNIVLDPEHYSAHTESGRKLLAHELAHVIQQLPSSSEGSSVDALSPQLRRAELRLQRQGSPDANVAAERQHRENQLRVAKIIGQTVWDKARRREEPVPATEEHKSRHPQLLLANSEQWIRTGLATLTVLTPTPDQSGVTLGERKFFDPTVKYPSVGGSVTHSVNMEANLDGKTDGKDISLFVTPQMDDRRLAETVIHEVQHVAANSKSLDEKQRQAIYAEQRGSEGEAHSYMFESKWEQYENEFRAYWLGSTPHPIRPWVPSQPDEQDRFGSEQGAGGELKVAEHPELKGDPNCLPGKSLQLANAKQTAIARQIVGSYGGMEQAFLCSEVFRQRLLKLDHGESINFVNSVRIERLRHAMQSGSRNTIWGTPPQPASTVFAVAFAVKHLDEVDLSFLRDPGKDGTPDSRPSKPLWDEARSLLSAQLFQWMENFVVRRMTDIPPPQPQDQQ